MPNKFAARAAALRANKGTTAAKPAAAKKASSKKATTKVKRAATSKGEKTERAPRKPSREYNEAKVIKMWEAGKTAAEISEDQGLTDKGNWPYYYTLGILRRLKAQGKIKARKGK